ncbi:hypothetical protein IAQ61_010468 [Plenodomus lingam]|uniref:uncharacterized protein n=1 Tax=Leptosphaeria maculans TaxID=5022 RepID=UPI00331DC564|nr:hypothetical protein IAQ61_010468 [Plenodomus lingam]
MQARSAPKTIQAIKVTTQATLDALGSMGGQTMLSDGRRWGGVSLEVGARVLAAFHPRLDDQNGAYREDGHFVGPQGTTSVPEQGGRRCWLSGESK